MRGQIVVALALAVCSSTAFASSCDGMKSRIEGQIKAHGVKNYTLAVVRSSEVKDGKVLASCERGSKKVVYKRN